MLRRAAIAVIVALAIGGCTSTVVLGTLGDAGPPNDLSQPRFDLADGAIDGNLPPDGFDGADALPLVDLAQ